MVAHVFFSLGVPLQGPLLGSGPYRVSPLGLRSGQAPSAPGLGVQRWFGLGFWLFLRFQLDFGLISAGFRLGSAWTSA